jgi:benzoate-CoA ligase family protein
MQVPERFNLTSYFVDRHIAEGHGARIAIRCEGESVCYNALERTVNRAGNALRRLGVKRSDRVLLALPDSPEFAAAWFGCIKIGAVAVPTSTCMRPLDYAYFLDESEARVLIFAAGLWNVIEPALDGRRHLRHIVVTEEKLPGAPFWDEWVGSESAALEPADTAADEIAFWLWTSGSTGNPKAAAHRHRDWVHCCESYAGEVLNITERDVTYSSSKLYHAYGLGNALMFPMWAGATTVLCPHKPNARTVLQTAADSRPTLFFSVPTLYAAMLRETEEQNPYRLDSVRLGISAAEPLPAGVYQRWKERFGFEILDGIGSTEALHIYISSRAGDVQPGRSGTPVSGYDVRVVDEDERDAETGEVGELWVRGASVAPSYWNRPQLTAERMRGEWFVTGDRYRTDDDGFYWYMGRFDEMFRVSGQWVSPVEVESTLGEHEAVLESAVAPYADQDRLLKPAAYVVLKRGWEPAEELRRELQEWVKQRIAPYKYPRRVEFLEELPKTATGKIQRYKLREMEAEPAVASGD